MSPIPPWREAGGDDYGATNATCRNPRRSHRAVIAACMQRSYCGVAVGVVVSAPHKD